MAKGVKKSIVMKKKILIINKVQFGYHTDSYKYCQYLKDLFDITYLCFDNLGDRIKENKITVHYIPYEGSFIKRGLRFVSQSRQYISNDNFYAIFAVYFQMVSLLKLSLPIQNFILDIRSGAVGMSLYKRKFHNLLIKCECFFFNNITIVSECLHKKLNLKQKNVHILPLGADVISETDKSFDNFQLLYVGTLNHRMIEDTIYGLSIFHSSNKNVPIRYDIVGDGSIESQLLVEDAIKKEKLDKIVFLHGRKKNNEIEAFFKDCNIGVSYVPITEYYDCQPPTKTFEYINSGMICIATNIKIHRDLITNTNGILCDDNAISFAKILKELYLKRSNYNSTSIKKTLAEYNWKTISESTLASLLINSRE